ncbi:hypothetical protein TIFTF001_050698 [Ficus carica]|uniref:Uncharacterized protein n=1 Tax=Ficus carica TaxID=3494 RepID=A0AA87Z601_FICCA|nr:hypothetical protein TIFTF001_050698 [Ficus carica]
MLDESCLPYGDTRAVARPLLCINSIFEVKGRRPSTTDGCLLFIVEEDRHPGVADVMDDIQFEPFPIDIRGNGLGIVDHQVPTVNPQLKSGGLAVSCTENLKYASSCCTTWYYKVAFELPHS